MVFKKILSIFLLVYSFSFVLSASGVSPAKYEIDFEPNFIGEYKFNFFFEEGTNSEVYVSGDLENYVEIDKKKIEGRGSVTAKIFLPESLDRPGNHIIRIGAKETPKDPEGFALASDVGGLIVVKVPYPGKYLEMESRTENVNAGEPLNLFLKLSNKGTENFTVDLTAELYSKSENLLVNSFDLGDYFILATEEKNLRKNISTEDVPSGDYLLKIRGSYSDKVAITSSEIRLGDLFVNITNYTSGIQKGVINRFEMRVESHWNDRIDNIHAEIRLKGVQEAILSPTTTLDPWQQTVLTGFIDAEDLEGDYIVGIVRLYYDGKISSHDIIIDLRRNKDLLLILVLVGIIILLIVSTFVTYILMMKHGKK